MHDTWVDLDDSADEGAKKFGCTAKTAKNETNSFPKQQKNEGKKDNATADCMLRVHISPTVNQTDDERAPKNHTLVLSWPKKRTKETKKERNDSTRDKINKPHEAYSSTQHTLACILSRSCKERDKKIVLTQDDRSQKKINGREKIIGGNQTNTRLPSTRTRLQNTLEEKKTSPGPPDLFRQFQTPAIAKKHTNKRSTKEEEKSKVWQSTDRTKTHVQRKINEGKKRDRDKGKQKI